MNRLLKTNLIGIDIGGTKCAVILGRTRNGDLEIVDKVKFPTTDVATTLEKISETTETLMRRHELTPDNTAAIGISCGGPLDSRKGIIMSPPNLPGWDNIPIVGMLSERFGIPAAIQNDANACALAEWKYGAGRGFKNVVFLTFGTGLGAGLILDGKLYDGSNGNAGEVGHIRLAGFGPVGYGKQGSFEGFCSGGGIAQLARTMIREKQQMGECVPFCPTPEDLSSVTAQTVAEAAKNGDRLAARIFSLSGEYLGRGLAVVMDLLNPEVIILGSIFVRSRELLEPAMYRAIEADALPAVSAVCKIVPAQLDEQIGDFAALSVAADAGGV